MPNAENNSSLAPLVGPFSTLVPLVKLSLTPLIVQKSALVRRRIRDAFI